MFLQIEAFEDETYETPCWNNIIIEDKPIKTMQYETNDEFLFLLDNARKQRNQLLRTSQHLPIN